MTQKNSKVKIYLTEFRVQGENTIYEGPNIFASSSEIAENIAEQMGVTIQAVYMAIKQGRLTAIKDNQGKIVINSDTMKDEWSKKSEPKLIKKTEHKTYKSSQSTTQYPEYGESKARTEHLKAELLELERQEKEKSLVDLVAR